MIPENIEENKIKGKVTQSEAWPEDVRTRYKVSQVHSIIPENIEVSDIKYKLVDKSYLEEVKKLHEEWFPVHYDNDYFSKINQGKSFCMGAFWNEHLIGIFIGHFKSNYMTKQLSNRGWFSFQGCKGLYIATIGVIDEVRRLGIGTILIDEVLKWVKIHHSN